MSKQMSRGHVQRRVNKLENTYFIAYLPHAIELEFFQKQNFLEMIIYPIL